MSDSILYSPSHQLYLVLFPRHFQGPLAASAISKIQVFRDYFHYHIKASKSYLHSRMRARVDSLLKILNRAKPELPSEQKTARLVILHPSFDLRDVYSNHALTLTIQYSGKTFKRS